MTRERARSASERTLRLTIELARKARHGVETLMVPLVNCLHVPSAIAVADRDAGTVFWFGEAYALRSPDGIAARGPTLPLLVVKVPCGTTIGRISGDDFGVHLTYLSQRSVDRRSLQKVASAWLSNT